MAKDYGNKRATRHRKGPHQLLAVLASFLVGYLTASFLDIQVISQWVNTQVLAQPHEVGKELTKTVQEHKEIPPKPKFEFYTLLANERGPTQQAANQQATIPPEEKSSAPIQNATNALTVAVNNSVKLATATAKPSEQVAKATEENARNSQQPGNGKYLVQVASFKARQDAEHMKGMLILKGFDVRVVPVVTQAQGSWFRVVVGPYPSRALAQKAQMTLAKTERLNGMVRSVGG
ncbi:cell division protein FtsN [Legionella norrlandica]|uniref:Cell division protein FtsN n=1 Tax=Legionella norrlandica TaxID=1498499 RepID=A0A0A2SVI3_9GAMM|nr:SPOR domain-containing protein [Legionella norrlandica]KGP63399.1 cell division protein FtsN [Legionella norrlandica]